MDDLIKWLKENGITHFQTPQFERIGELDFKYIPESNEDFDKFIRTAPRDILIGCGFREWGEGLFLFPGEWYDSIPEGFEIVVINGSKRRFRSGSDSTDIRYGCLAYGVIRDDLLP